MSKASSTIVEMCRRYKDLEKAGKPFAKMSGPGRDDPRYGTMLNEMTEIENRVIVTPARTKADIRSKKRMIRIANDAGCDFEALVDTILQLDAERVAAAGGDHAAA
jgi:hypothetical protein